MKSYSKTLWDGIKGNIADSLAHLVVLLFVFMSLTAPAQIRKYPADISPVIGQPASVYLSDYIAPGSNLLSANIVFNDFNEASWNFRLKIRIESQNLRMETMQEFRPLAPISVSPGVIRTFSGADWEEYLNYNNLNIAGVPVSQLINSGGRLPEGLYTFCFQVLDYDTGDPLSAERCQTAYIKLLEAPRINAPQCNVSLDPKQTQHNFIWQMFDAPSPNATDAPQFQLTIWEVTERSANIQTAVQNGQALQIYQSQILSQPSYNYSLSDPPLELGKQYIFRVQAIDPDGKDKFKNQGFSEYCSFYYGWPTGGNITLKFPEEGGGFRKKDIPTFRWSAVDSQLPAQEVSYEIRIVPMEAGQTKEAAIVSNQPWETINTPQAAIAYDRAQEINKTLNVMTKYAWQVRAFTDQQEVGTSGVSYFNGPALMESFWVSIHRVEVDYLDGTDINDLSGGGRIRFTPQADAWTAVRFEHIRLDFNGSFYVMTGGEFFYELPEPMTIELNPALAENGKAYFDISRFRVNKDGINAEGSARWTLPLPALSDGVPVVRTEKLFASYNNFAVNTAAKVLPGTQFDLLEPFNFTLDINNSSVIYVNENKYWLDFQGTIELPDNVKGTGPDPVRLPYASVDQLFYFEQDSLTNPAIAPLAKADFQLLATRYILDLSEQESPAKFQNDPGWKGLYFQDFDLRFNPSLDGKGQFDLAEMFKSTISQPLTGETDAWVTSGGLNLKFDISFPDSIEMVFQSFPAHLNRFSFDLDEGQVNTANSFLKGRLRIPVISNDEKFLFTVPVNNLGFDNGSLDNLVNTRFTHNPGSGDQELHITVKRAVLSGFEKIGMTVDLEWPSLGVTLTDLRGFNAWGDYNIGFDNKNGTVPLSQRYNATLSTYPITISVIGAGSNNGTYVIATTADAGLGDDVSGGEGVPSINIYSVVANQYVPLEADGAIEESTTDQISFTDASSGVTKDFAQLQQTLEDNVNAEQERLVSEAEALKNSLAEASGGTLYSAEEMVPSDEQSFPAEPGQGSEPGADAKFNSRQQEIIYEIAAGFVEELSRPLLDPIKRKTDSLSATITLAVDGLVNDANTTITTSVDRVVMTLANELASALQNDKVNISGPIRDMGMATSERISREITASLRIAVKNNIIDPVNILLKEQINGRINKHVTENGTKIVYATITGEMSGSEDALKDLINGTPDVMEAIIKDVMAFVSIDNMKSTVDATATEFIKNINMNAVGHDLRVAAEKILADAVADEVGEAISGLAEKYADDLGLGGFGIAGENPIRFQGAAQKLAEGDIKGVFAIDPVRVKLRTPVIDLDGFMKYTPEHPVYGDVWLGDIDMTIKVPKRFAFNAIYFNGRKDDIAYWFCQITPPESNNTPYELGKPLAKTAKPLQDPVDIGVAKIVGASGRLYHHMKETPNSGIVPDASMRYGAFMHFVFYDKGSSGKNLRLEVSGEINTAENGDYTIAFDGNLQLRSNAVEVMEPDKTAVVQGLVMIRYNSAEEHFLGYAKVVVNDPGKLCASASLLVDVKPGKWRVAIGSREDRIVFVPGCVGWSPTGWLDLNESVAELGLGVQYSGGAKSPDINLGFVEFNVQVEAGIAFGIVAAVQYNPDFALLKAGVWVDIWASIIANYKLPLKDWKKITLVEIYIRGDLVIIFNPPPTAIQGRLDGTCRIIGFSIDFSAKIDKTI